VRRARGGVLALSFTIK